MQTIEKKVAKKRINIVDVVLVKDKTILYGEQTLRDPFSSQMLFREILGEKDREHFAMVCLDTKNRPTHFQVVHIGGLNSSIVQPREVFKVAILSNAASVIFFHNHPSGDTTPSREDIEVTERLQEVGKIVGINVLDHIIIGENMDYYSLAQAGYLSN